MLPKRDFSRARPELRTHMLLASTFLEALVPDGPGAGGQALSPSEESSVPDTVSAKGKQRVKDLLTGIQQENRKRSRFEWSGQGRVDQFRDAAAMAYREQPQTPSTVCPSSLAPDTRLVLSAWVSTGFHGSTALSVPASPYEIIRKSCSA